MKRIVLLYGQRYQIDSWTNCLEDWFALCYGWTVYRTPKHKDKRKEQAEILALAADTGANVFLANHVAWTGGPDVEALNAFREAGMLTAAISHDEPYRWDGYDRRAAQQAPGYDVWFTNWNDPAHLERHTAGRVVYSPCAARPEFIPKATPQDVPVGFLGVYYPPRDPYLRAVADLGLRAYMIPRTEPPFHPWPPPPDILACVPTDGTSYITPHEVADFCRRSVVSLDISEQPDGRVRCPKNRMFETMACGSFSLAGWCAQTEDLFTEGADVALYRTADECRQLAEYYLQHAEDRRVVAEQGSRTVRAQHMWMHRVAEMSRELDLELQKREAAPAFPLGVVITTKDRPGLFCRAYHSVRGLPIVTVNAGTQPLPDGAYRRVDAAGANASTARNIGLDALPESVEWVKFLDDDDTLYAGWDASYAGKVDPDAAAVVSGANSRDSRDVGYVAADRAYTSQILFHRKRLREAGGWDQGVTLAEERELLRRLKERGYGLQALELPMSYKGGEDERVRIGSHSARMPPTAAHAPHRRF